MSLADGAALAGASPPRIRRGRVRAAVVRFLAAPASPLPLGVMRVGLGVALVVQAVPVLPHLDQAFGTLGLVQGPLVDRLAPPLAPRVGWAVDALAPLGIGETLAIRLFLVFHLTAAVAFAAGWRTRAAAVCTWATFVALTTSSPLYVYGVDRFLRIALFYAMFAPVGAALSCDVVAGRTSGAPSPAARLWLRIFQVHLVIVYVASGVEKATGEQWWNGEALWRAMMRPDLATMDFDWVASVPWFAIAGCWATLVLEIGYGFFVWPRRTSRWWVLAVLGMHAGVALTLGLWIFSATMMLLSACAWLVPYEPRALRTSRGSGFAVAYDGSCRVCRSVVGLAFGLDREGFLPVGRRHGRRLPAASPEEPLDRMVTVGPDGRVRHGVDAFLAMWAHALRAPWIGKLARFGPVRLGYALFARHRHALGCSDSCPAKPPRPA